VFDKKILKATAIVFMGISSLCHEASAAPDEARIASLIRSGNVQEAFDELQNSNPRIEDVLFFRGLVAQRNEDYVQAVSLFNEALSVNPNHLNARRELANTLFMQGRYRQAEQAFTELIVVDNTPNMGRIYNEYIRNIHAQKPIGVTGHFSILPSSNLNRGTENLTFDSSIGDFVIDPESQAKSGIGLRGGLSGYFRLPSDSESRSALTWGLIGTVYEDSEHNSVTGNLRFSHLSQIDDATTIGWGLYARYTWRDDDADNSTLGVNLNLTHAVTQKDTISLNLQHEQREYFHQPHNTGPFSSLRLGFSHQQNASLSYSFGLTASQRITNTSHSAYNGLEMAVGIDKAWYGGLITGLSASAGTRNYETDFPLAGEARADEFYGITVSVQNNEWNVRGFTPRVSCSYLHNSSNIEFYDYSVSECSLSINKRF
jgi:hypothetical protein